MNWTSKTNLAPLKISRLHDKIGQGLVTYGTLNKNYHYISLHMESSDILSDFLMRCLQLQTGTPTEILVYLVWSPNNHCWRTHVLVEPSLTKMVNNIRHTNRPLQPSSVVFCSRFIIGPRIKMVTINAMFFKWSHGWKWSFSTSHREHKNCWHHC